ncbi:hypothetical protein LX77_00426 [Gelidibacter algens]|uniref:YtkA-like protein n=1 Tax=Gelidibacter algens TaxID=49280 RepID=A0A1A7R2A4_9FLAO|nr:hypothetical protein [Gelidibacter algens]OBX25604.1 hypothetical protein A9996_09200 [Gelidibacter algens]RAJ27852.1 hypothetical protein LX77_00426 [Gelidibacter algens]
MKLKYIIPILCVALLTLSCSTDDDTDPIINEVEDLVKIKELTNATHTIELFNASGTFKTGYNAISIRIKDNAANTYVTNATLSWMPVMQMPTMQHSAPKSDISKALAKKTVYDGFIVYQMANLDGSGWSLTINYTINGTNYMASSDIVVMQSEYQNVTSFMGADGKRYLMAIVEPQDPKIGINTLKVGLYTMETMMSFPKVEGFRMTLDPRMPGMGNHSSPNNTDLTYNMTDGLYEGNLSLTMTGYWVLNLKLLNAADEVLKGENVTEQNPKSSLYLELEF